MSNIVFDQLSVFEMLFQMTYFSFVALVVYKLIYRIWYEL